MHDSSMDDEFERWELYGKSSTCEAGKSIEQVELSYNKKRIKSIIVDLRDD